MPDELTREALAQAQTVKPDTARVVEWRPDRQYQMPRTRYWRGGDADDGETCYVSYSPIRGWHVDTEITQRRCRVA